MFTGIFPLSRFPMYVRLISGHTGDTLPGSFSRHYTDKCIRRHRYGIYRPCMVGNVPVRTDNDPFLPVFCNNPLYDLVSLFVELRINDRHAPADRSALIALAGLITVKYYGYVMPAAQLILYDEANKLLARLLHIAERCL